MELNSIILNYSQTRSHSQEEEYEVTEYLLDTITKLNDKNTRNRYQPIDMEIIRRFLSKIDLIEKYFFKLYLALGESVTYYLAEYFRNKLIKETHNFDELKLLYLVYLKGMSVGSPDCDNLIEKAIVNIFRQTPKVFFESRFSKIIADTQNTISNSVTQENSMEESSKDQSTMPFKRTQSEDSRGKNKQQKNDEISPKSQL